MTILNNISLKVLKFLVLLFPVSFLFGSPMINTCTILISLTGLFYYNKNIFSWLDKIPLYITTLFFLCIIFSSYYQFVSGEENKDTIKSLLFLRYFVFLIVIKTMVMKTDLNLKHFFISSLFISVLISLDIIIQFIFGKNILGYEPIEFTRQVKYYTSVFGKELVAGGFVQMFSIIGIFSIFFIFKRINNKLFLYSLFFIFVSLFLISLTLAGNRMPLVMFIIFLILVSLIIKIKNKKFYLIGTSSVIILIFSIIVYDSDVLIKRSMNFYAGIPKPPTIINELKKEYPELKKYENSGIPFHNSEEFLLTKLKSSIDNKTKDIELTDASKFPTNGINYVQIGYEEILYTGIIKNNLQGVKRGMRDTVPSVHEKGSTVTGSNFYKRHGYFSGHLPIFITSLDLFLDKPILGNGIKSYRNNCYKKVHLPNRICQNHPHNFVLEILNDTGFLGFLIIYSLVLYLLHSNFKDYQLGETRKTEISNWIYLGIILGIIIQFFPFKSSGSFFSTFNATYTFMLIGISLGLNELKYKKNS
tara:strand:+ start:912 stop:2504 length:1593 start_codon:yes stop_codon:yes gene_type:complete